MLLPEAQHQLLDKLRTLYDEREVATIADWVLEKITGLKKIDRILLRDRSLSPDDQHLLNKYISELVRHRPVQYVLGETWFYKLRFKVDERVLIPRPETEELVGWILDEAINTGPASRILDIGTGSGCIPISLKKELPTASVFACDISRGALELARENALDNGVSMDFFELDILQTGEWPPLAPFDLIVSNPPYIPLKDRVSMDPNVLLFEPSLALFVDDEDPLVFYRAIAAFARRQLVAGGSIFVELHEDLAAQTSEVFAQYGFKEVVVKKDMQGKDRMIRASRMSE